jgi:hypothetical protein
MGLEPIRKRAKRRAAGETIFEAGEPETFSAPPRDHLLYNAGMKVTERIKSVVDEAHLHGHHPTKVYLTVDDGRKLQFELIEQGGRLGEKIMREGVRKAVHKIEGVEVVWRSPEFKVD